jgi:enoyl-CoA hydratase/carnithine racemase
MSEYVSVSEQERVRHIILDRPDKRNAIHHDMVLELRDAARDAYEATDVHCVIVRGEGRCFSAGIDINQLGNVGGANLLRPFRRDCVELVNLLEEMPRPVIAQIHGACLGLGAEIALACDIRVMSADVLFGLPETKLGLIPDVGGSSRLPAVVGLGVAKELIMTGRTIDAAECHRIGVANRVVPAEQLEAETQSLVEELLSAAPLAAGLAKRVLDGVAKPTLAASLEQEVSIQQILVGTEDFREAGMAYLEKRPPRFTGAAPGTPLPETEPA